MIKRIIIAGAGGQGIMLLGKVLAIAAMQENKNVTWLPAYGAEVRGGTAHCSVIIADEEIGSPCVDRADFLIVMNEPSWNKFKHKIAGHGVLFINDSLVRTANINSKNITGGPFTQIASELGNIKIANMVALGMFVKYTGICSHKTVLEVIKNIGRGRGQGLIDINIKAFEMGEQLLTKDNKI